MRRSQPSAEEAIAHLLYVAFIQIRAMAGRRRPFGPPSRDQDEDFIQWIRELADACHNLPASLGHGRGRERRRRAAAQLEYLWKVATPRQLEWIHFHLDDIGYDYGRLDRLREATHAKLRADGHLA